MRRHDETPLPSGPIGLSGKRPPLEVRPAGRMAACSTLRVSDLRRHLGLTVRAIRHYEELGLIRPARDSLNRRVFDAMACAQLRVIGLLRKAGIGLPAISVILERGLEGAAAAGRLTEAVAARRVELEGELAAVAEVADALRTPFAISGLSPRGRR